MNALFYLKLYALTVPVFFIIDLIWLGVIAKGFYHKNISSYPNVSPRRNGGLRFLLFSFD